MRVFIVKEEQKESLNNKVETVVEPDVVLRSASLQSVPTTVHSTPSLRDCNKNVQSDVTLTVPYLYTTYLTQAQPINPFYLYQ